MWRGKLSLISKNGKCTVPNGPDVDRSRTFLPLTSITCRPFHVQPTTAQRQSIEPSSHGSYRFDRIRREARTSISASAHGALNLKAPGHIGGRCEANLCEFGSSPPGVLRVGNSSLLLEIRPLWPCPGGSGHAQDPWSDFLPRPKLRDDVVDDNGVHRFPTCLPSRTMLPDSPNASSRPDRPPRTRS